MADQFEAIKVKAGGNIRIGRFVRLLPLGPFTVVEASTATEPIFGISTIAARNEASTTYAAATGDPVLVYQDGAKCYLKVGGTAISVAGKFLKSGASSSSLVWAAGTATQYVGARSLELAGTTAGFVQVQVKTFTTGAQA